MHYLFIHLNLPVEYYFLRSFYCRKYRHFLNIFRDLTAVCLYNSTNVIFCDNFRVLHKTCDAGLFDHFMFVVVVFEKLNAFFRVDILNILISTLDLKLFDRNL